VLAALILLSTVIPEVVLSKLIPAIVKQSLSSDPESEVLLGETMN
jgi:hypothetical protein